MNAAPAARFRKAALAVLLAVPVPRAGAAPPPAPAPWGPIQEVEGTRPRQLLVKGKPHVYFRVEPRGPIHFTVRGPARLVVISRAELREGSTGSFPYFIRVLGPHSPLKVRAMASSPASDAALADGTHATICESRRLVVSIPEGEQHVWISVSGVPGVFVRLLRLPPGGDREGMTAIPPEGVQRAVLVEEGGERIPFYTVTHGRPLRYRVTGPTPFALVSRLDLAKSESGPTPYVLSVSSGGKTLRTLRYTAVPSRTATYPDRPDRVPSRADSSELPLDPGPAEIRIQLLQPAGGAVDVHARVAETPEGEEE